jgi:glycerate-2-kinase
MTCDEQARLTHLLMTKGAAIEEINTVRKHISNVKGGNLAKICYPAMVVSLIFSDVPNDDLGMVASGPTVLDTSTIHDAEKILQKYDALTLCKLPHCALYETPKNLDYFKNVHNILMVSPQRALESMASKAEELGFRSKIWNAAYTGDAALIAKDIVQAFEPGVCLLGAGESTVVVSGNGKGGRNQHLALVALEYVAQKQILVTVASDGVDNSDHAGAIADKITASHASSKMLNPNMYIKNNDSYTFFSETGDGLITGKTGANISDLFVSIEAL